MRRILATLVLSAVSLTLFPAALFASSDDLPACCRKDGKHKCAMAGMDEDTDGPTLRGVSECPAMPSRSSAVPAANALAAAPQQNSEIHVASFLNTTEQAEAQYRISFSRSRQKRGPPSFLSL